MKPADKLTPEERKKVTTIAEKYANTLLEAVTRANEVGAAASKLVFKNPKELSEQERKTIEEFEASQGIINRLQDVMEKADAEVYKAAEDRFYNKFVQDPASMMDELKFNLYRMIGLNYSVFYNEIQKQKAAFQDHVEAVRKELKKVLTDPAELEEGLKALKEESAALEEKLTAGFNEIMEVKVKGQMREEYGKYIDYLEKNSPELYEEFFSFYDLCLSNKAEIAKDYDVTKILHSLQELTQKESKGIKKPENIRTKGIGRFLSPTNRISNVLFGYEKDVDTKQLIDNEACISVIRGKNGKDVETMLSINLDDLKKLPIKIDISKPLTLFDREVHDAIVSCAVDGGNRVIPFSAIYRAMTGSKDLRITPNQTELIRKSVNKLRFTSVTIDATQEAEFYGKTDDKHAFGFKKFKYNDYVIPAAMMQVTTVNNNETKEDTCIRLHSLPPLYTYANEINQVTSFPVELLDTPGRKNEETIVLQGYLLRRIGQMKNTRNKVKSKTILYDTIFSLLDVKASTAAALRKKKSKIRGKVRALLQYWKEQGYIYGFEEIKEGSEIHGVVIYTTKKHKREKC